MRHFVKSMVYVIYTKCKFTSKIYYQLMGPPLLISNQKEKSKAKAKLNPRTRPLWAGGDLAKLQIII